MIRTIKMGSNIFFDKTGHGLAAYRFVVYICNVGGLQIFVLAKKN